MLKKQRVLFLCTTNSCRSQMAEGFLRQFYGERFEVYSAGSRASSVHRLAIKVMAELGIDISQQSSKSVKEFNNQEFDYVITICGGYAKNTCPVFLGKIKNELHWDFIDPAEAKGSEAEVLAVFRKVRDEIKNKIVEFVDQVKNYKRSSASLKIK